MSLLWVVGSKNKACKMLKLALALSLSFQLSIAFPQLALDTDIGTDFDE